MFQTISVFENAHLNNVNINLINILQKVISVTVTSFENNDVEPDHQIILQKLFQCLEMLYNHVILTQEEADEVHNWLTDYCKTHCIEDIDLNTLVHKLLFTQRIRTQKGPIFEGIAKQIEALLTQIQEVRSFAYLEIVSFFKGFF